MATSVNQAYYDWSRDEFPDRNNSQDVSIAQMLDHGSISFGRYAVESLSWEKRSVFTYNKCQEELEKFKAPGLVAQKKAYFEEYYRNLRAQKALQENQQTELTMDYGGDGSISSQTGEEDETASQLEILRDVKANVTDVLSEEDRSKVNAEQEMNYSEPLERSSSLDSSSRSMERIELEKTSDNACEMHNSDTGFMGQRLFMRNIEAAEQSDHNKIEGKGISKMEETAPSDVGSEVPRLGTAVNSRTARVEISKVARPYDIVQEKTKKILKKTREASISKEMEPAASVRNGANLDSKTKSNLVKSSRPLQKSSSKAEGCISSRKQIADRVAINKKSTLVASDKSCTEVRPSVTIPRPFSFATERRASVPASVPVGIKETTSRMDSKTSSRLEPLRVPAKSSICVQITPKRAAITSSVKGGGPEKSVHEEVRKRPLAMESKYCVARGSAGNMIRTQKARSINLPSRSMSNHNVGTEIRLTSKIEGDKGRERKDARRECHGVKTKILTENKTMVALQSGDPSVSRRRPWTPDLSLGRGKPRKEMLVPQTEDRSVATRPQTADLSLDRRNPRKEMPRWR